jgi:hypothetical protein
MPAPSNDAGARPGRRRLLALGALVPLAALLPGCALLKQSVVDVASFGAWPSGRRAGAYAFDRLPSQQADPAAQQRLEQAAAQALERVGFVAAATPAQADVLVQLDSRFSRVLSPFADPWPGPFAPVRRAPPPPDRRIHGSVVIGSGVGFGAGFGWQDVHERQQLLMLLVDRASRERLVEIRIEHEARHTSPDLLPLMFEAGLQGFPDLPPGTRRVTIQLP